MEFRVILRLAVPLLAVLFGFIIRKSEKEQHQSYKKYWVYFVIGANWYVTYASTCKGGYAITGINRVQDSGKNDGTIVAYIKGIEQYRRKL